MATFTKEIKVTVDEFLDELDHDEKVGLFERLSEELNTGEEEMEEFDHDFIEHFRSLSDFDKRKFLVDAFYVSNYYDDDALRDALAPIINAR